MPGGGTPPDTTAGKNLQDGRTAALSGQRQPDCPPRVLDGGFRRQAFSRLPLSPTPVLFTRVVKQHLPPSLFGADPPSGEDTPPACLPLSPTNLGAATLPPPHWRPSRPGRAW